MSLNTIDEIAQHFFKTLSAEDVQYIAGDQDGLERVWLESSIAREIRNRYGLWNDSPLTERWRTDKSAHDIRDGVDFSEDHPDAVSAKILKVVAQLCRSSIL